MALLGAAHARKRPPKQGAAGHCGPVRLRARRARRAPKIVSSWLYARPVSVLTRPRNARAWSLYAWIAPRSEKKSSHWVALLDQFV
jgi:hypothetical protein